MCCANFCFTNHDKLLLPKTRTQKRMDFYVIVGGSVVRWGVGTTTCFFARMGSLSLNSVSLFTLTLALRGCVDVEIGWFSLTFYFPPPLPSIPWSVSFDMMALTWFNLNICLVLDFFTKFFIFFNERIVSIMSYDIFYVCVFYCLILNVICISYYEWIAISY